MSDHEDLEPQEPEIEPAENQPINKTEIDIGPPCGMRRIAPDGQGMIDALAGRSSVFGFGFGPIVTAIQHAAEGYLGDASALEPSIIQDDSLPESLLELLGESSGITPDSILLCSSADEAVDRAIGLARQNGRDHAFRTVALVGSDHGRTGMCRTASGKPELSAGFGPMMSGFAHVPVGNLDAVRNVIDDQTACILLSPVDFSDAARPVDSDFLIGLRELCDQHSVLLIFDESRIAFGASGQPFTFASIANIKADMVIVAAGLFGGIAGGLIVATEQATNGSVYQTGNLPIQAAVATATLTAMNEQHLLESVGESMRDFAVAVAETLGGFQLIRDVHVAGMTLGVQADIECDELVKAAAKEGLRIESAGATAFRIQPPLVMDDQDREQLLEMMKQAMESVERATASLGV